MKKSSFDYATTATVTKKVIRNSDPVREAEKLIREASTTPPSEETVARLNAIAREYPFCAFVRQNNLFLL